jgi:chromosome segregation ATPase
MATTRRNLKDVINTEGQKLNNTAPKDKDSNNSNAKAEQDLAATIAELKAALAAAKKREDTLEKQVTSLQTDMNEQKAHVEKLEKLELKTELDEAKQTALKLAEKNSQLQAEIKALKAENKNSASKAESKSTALKAQNKNATTHHPSIYDRPIGYGDKRPAGQQNTETGDRQPGSNLKMWLD